jgi:NitT/TauT family transport system permease protein
VKALPTLAATAALAGTALVAAQPVPGATRLLTAAGAGLALAGLLSLRRRSWRMAATGLAAHAAAIVLLIALPSVMGRAEPGYWLLVVAAWLAAWAFVQDLSGLRPRARPAQRLLELALPLVFGVWLLILWEILVRGLAVPAVLLPAPSAIWARLIGSLPTLAADFRQTFLKAVLIGYAIGCLSGFLVALIVDRVPFLRRGLLPIGNLVSALPIVGMAPIMVMWFGFDWPSKAAVVVIMTFFPMLVNTVAGLAAAGAQERDLMRTYAAGHGQALMKLRLPAALPFIFNALKINSTLALIGAIVAEFFGTPIVGMGFRISTEVGRMNIDMVWAEIAVAALAGSLFYAAVAALERIVTFWHPSYRS